VNDGLLYDEQGRVVAELDASNNVLSTFVYGSSRMCPTTWSETGWCTHRQRLAWGRAARARHDQDGHAAVVERIDYDDWGNVTNLVDPECSVGGRRFAGSHSGLLAGFGSR